MYLVKTMDSVHNNKVFFNTLLLETCRFRLKMKPVAPSLNTYDKNMYYHYLAY